MAGFYVRDQLGRFAALSSGPAARSFESFFQEIAGRPPTPSGHFLANVAGVPRRIYIEGGYANRELASG